MVFLSNFGAGVRPMVLSGLPAASISGALRRELARSTMARTSVRGLPASPDSHGPMKAQHAPRPPPSGATGGNVLASPDAAASPAPSSRGAVGPLQFSGSGAVVAGAVARC